MIASKEIYETYLSWGFTVEQAKLMTACTANEHIYGLKTEK